MNFEDFKNKLSEELKNVLPGLDTQLIMMPKDRKRRPDIENSTKGIKNSAVLILLYPNENDIYISLIKRAVDGSKHSGQIAFPGGKFEETDLNLTETSLRETEEEIGVNKNDIKVLGNLTSLFIPVSNYDVKPIVGAINYKPKFKKNIDEVADIYSVKLKELKESYIVCKTIEIRKQKITAPFYILNDIEIWGATAMILCEFIEILNRVK